MSYLIYKLMFIIFFFQFLDEIDEHVIYALIQNVLTQHAEKANWKLLLSLISTFVKTKSHLCHMLKCMVFFYIFIEQK